MSVISGILFSLFALLAEIAGTLGGFGSSVFFVPLAGLFFDLHTVLVLTALLHVFSNISKLWLFRGHFNKRLLLLFGIPSILLVWLGAALTAVVSSETATLVLGVFIVLFSIVMLILPKLKLNATPSTAIISGGTAGFFAGLVGTGGAIRGLGLAAFGLGKEAFIATSAAIDMGVDLLRAVVYLNMDYLPASEIVWIPVLLGIAALGSWLGKKIVMRLDEDAWRRVLLLLLLLVGIWLLIRPLFTQTNAG
ncbi:MAG: sulfite exporter TauE/SafE family protein [Bacteroidia bacterium]